ncbi:unnamed protein product [Rotaria magnacalcarata]|nr:unnamed protein product [Rotaria magnacalcarata]
MATPREYHTATLLNSDKVIVIGGEGFAGYMTSCEIYDPSTGQWDVIASMKTARADHAAILLGSGKVLVAGGRGYSESLINCEIYDPLTSKWHPTANMSIAIQKQINLSLNEKTNQFASLNSCFSATDQSRIISIFVLEFKIKMQNFILPTRFMFIFY